MGLLNEGAPEANPVDESANLDAEAKAEQIYPEGTPDWMKEHGLEAEYAEAPMFKNIKDVQTLAKNYFHAQKSIGNHR